MSDSNSETNDPGFIFEGGKDFEPFTGSLDQINKSDLPEEVQRNNARIPLDPEHNMLHKEEILKLRKEMDVLIEEMDKTMALSFNKKLNYLIANHSYPLIEYPNEPPYKKLVVQTDIFKKDGPRLVTFLDRQTISNPPPRKLIDYDYEAYQIEIPLILDEKVLHEVEEYMKTHPDLNDSSQTRFLIRPDGAIRKIIALDNRVVDSDTVKQIEGVPYENDLEYIGIATQELLRQVRGEPKEKVKMT